MTVQDDVTITQCNAIRGVEPHIRFGEVRPKALILFVFLAAKSSAWGLLLLYWVWPWEPQSQDDLGAFMCNFMRFYASCTLGAGLLDNKTRNVRKYNCD